MNFRIALATLCVLPGLCAAQNAPSAHAPLPAQSETADWNWAHDDARISRSPEFAASKAICKSLQGQEPRASDWPDAAAAATLSDCDSAALYYGTGVTAAPVRARQCALLETQRADGNEGPFSGTAMLMTIYANGVGGERNLDLATSLACRIDGAPFEVDGRVKHLQKLGTEHWSGHNFSYCDDITSGMAQGLCAAHDASLVNVTRSETLDRLTRTWTAAERAHFQTLQTAMQAYAQASSDNEVDLGGTGRAAFMIEREQQVRNDFLKLLETLQTAALPAASAADDQRADKQLNNVYHQIMAIKPDTDGHIDAGTVTQSGIRTAQRAWLPYRDAWIAFAAAKYPQVTAASVRTALTRQRMSDLQDFVPEPRTAQTPFRATNPAAVTWRPLPAAAARVLEQSRSIVTGGTANAAPVFQVIFDPNAPSDAALWHNLQRLHPNLAVRWLPINYFGKDSAALAATLLDAPNPAAALAENFEKFDSHAPHGGVQPIPGKALGAAQTTLREMWIQCGGYTPMLIVIDADGQLRQTAGANPEIIEAVLDIARSAGRSASIPAH